MADTPLNPQTADPQPQSWRWSPDPMDPRRCVILVPFPNRITLPCQCALEELQRRGYHVWRVGGYSHRHLPTLNKSKFCDTGRSKNPKHSCQIC